MAPLVVQSNENFTANNATANPTVTVTLSSPTTAGNCLVVGVYSTNATTDCGVAGATLGGLAGNFGVIPGCVFGTGSSAAITSWWADPDCAGGQTSVAVSTSGGAGNSWVHVYVWEVSGLPSALAALLDVKDGTSSTTNSTSWSSALGNPVSTQPSEIWLGIGGNNSSATITGPTSPWANQASQGGGPISIAGYEITTATGSPVYSGSAGTTGHWAASVIALFAAPSTTPGVFAQAGRRMWKRRYVTQPPAPPGPPSFTAPAAIEASGTLSSVIARKSAGVSATQGSGTLSGTVAKNVTISSAIQGSGVLAGTALPVLSVNVTVAGSGAQSVPYTSVQPPAAWQSLQVPVTGIANGDWIFAIVSWRQNVTGAPGVAVTVGDDTMRNFWQPLGIPAASSSPLGATRSVIWYAPAAWAPAYVSVAPSGINPGTDALGIACTVLDVTGMLPWQTITGIATTYANAATTLSALTQSAPASQAILLTGCGTDNNSDTISLAGSGWTSLPPVSASNGTDHTADITLSSAWQLATGSTSATWSSSGSLDLSGVIGGALIEGTAPVQASPDWPVTVAELAPGWSPHLDSSAFTWVPVTTRSLELQNVVQGAQYNLAALTAGAGAVVFDNPDGALIPPGTGSYAGIDSGTPFRVRQIWPGGSWQVQWNGNGATNYPYISGPLQPVIAGQAYSFSAWLASSPAWTSGMYVQFDWQGSGGHISYSPGNTYLTGPSSSSAVLSAVTATAPAGATGVYIGLVAALTPPASTTFYAASAALDGEPGTIVLPPGITWNADNGATVYTLAPWAPDPKGPPNGCPYGVPFSGYIRSWPQAWDPALLRGVTAATVTDAWGYCNGNVQPILIEEILNDSPYAYWPCTDPAGSVQAVNYAPGNSRPLTVAGSKNGVGAATYAFDSNSGAILGASGTYLLTSSVRAQQSGGMWEQDGVVTTSTFTATSASPCVFTVPATATAPPDGTAVVLTGSLPGGFSTGTVYYVIDSSSSTFELSASSGGSAINSSSTGTGSFTVTPLEGYSLECIDGGYPPVSAGVTVEGWFLWTASQPSTTGTLLQLMTATRNVLNFNVNAATPAVNVTTTGANGTTTVTSVTLPLDDDDLPVFPATVFYLACTFTQTTYSIYYNGVLTNSGTWANALPAKFQYLWANGNLSVYGTLAGGQYQGDTGHVAVTEGLLTPERIATHWIAGMYAMAGDTPDARIERLLQAGNNYSGPRVILQDYGTDITPCASCQDVSGQPAATSIQNIAASTPPAVLAVSPPGYLTYLSRGKVWNQPVKWVLGNNTTSGEIPFLSDINFAYDPLRLLNDVQLTQLDNQDIVVPQPPIGGATGIDYQSQQTYGDQPYWVTGYLENDLLSALSAGPGLLDLANWIGGTNAVPGNRLGGVTVDASSHPDAWTFFMTVARGDIVTVNWRPPTATGLLISVTGRVSQTTRNLKWALDGCTGSVSLLIDLAPEVNCLTLDDPVRGLLNGENCLAW